MLISLLGWGLFALADYEGQLYAAGYASRQALYIAEAGAQRAQARLALTDDWTTLPSTLYQNKSFAGGTYTVVLSDVSQNQATITSTGSFKNKSRQVTVEVSSGL